MIDLCREEINEIIFFDISQLEMMNICEKLQNRFEKGRTLPGTRSFHHFVPQSNSKISYKITSNDDFFSGSFNFFNDNSFQLEMKMITIGRFVSCVYDTFWWIGMVEYIDETDGDLSIKFFHPYGPSKSFYWPSRDDTCDVPINNILCLISPPSTATGRTYQISDDDYEKTVLAFAKCRTE